MPEIKTVDVDKFKDSVFVSLSVSRWPARATCRSVEKLTAYLELLNAPDDNGAITAADSIAIEGAPRRSTQVTAANVTKTTYPLVKCAELDAINKFLNERKAALCGEFGKAMPSRIKNGLHVIAKSEVESFFNDVTGAKDKLTLELLPAFIAALPAAINRARTLPVKQGGLGPLFDERDYPPEHEIERSFDLDLQLLSLGVADDLPEGIRAQAREAFEKRMTEAADEVRDALRASLGEFVGHLVERLTPGEDGKPKVFRDTLIGNIAQFCEVFDSRNVMRDDELKALVEKAKGLLVGVTPDKLREYSSVKENTLSKFTEIKTALDGMITERKGRKFNLSE